AISYSESDAAPPILTQIIPPQTSLMPQKISTLGMFKKERVKGIFPHICVRLNVSRSKYRVHWLRRSNRWDSEVLRGYQCWTLALYSFIYWFECALPMDIYLVSLPSIYQIQQRLPLLQS